MKTTANLKLLLPEGKDPVNISDITSNFEALDTYLVDMQTAASDASRNTVTFATASDRQNVASTESLSTIVGKIAKWFSDLKAAAFCTVANNETTTAEGVVLDARVGKKHGDQLNGLYFKRDANGKMGYATSETGTVTPFRNPTGDATAAEVLSGKSFSSATLENEKGTMTNNGAWTSSTTGDGNVTIPAGYHNGSGYVSGKTSYNDGYAKGYDAGYAAVPLGDFFEDAVILSSGGGTGSTNAATVGKYCIYCLGKNGSDNATASINGMDTYWSMSGITGDGSGRGWWYIFVGKITSTSLSASTTGFASSVAGSYHVISELR